MQLRFWRGSDKHVDMAGRRDLSVQSLIDILHCAKLLQRHGSEFSEHSLTEFN